MKPLKAAVIGVGYLGKFHADKYAAIDNVELVAVCDNNLETAQQIADKHGVLAVTDYRELLGTVDCVSIAAPTTLHYDISRAFLTHGAHVLVEKPICQTVEQANELIALAAKHKRLLQVGHLERFNAARMALQPYITRPLFIESNRLAPFKPRATDVNVVLDLMIHDIDIIQSIVQSPIKTIDAHGAPVLSDYIDIANARIQFENGCVANVNASRVSFKAERKTRIFQPKSYISLDFQENKFAVFNKGKGEMFPGIPEIDRHESAFKNNDSLLLEIQAFIDSITQHKPAAVTGEDGRNALATAQTITKLCRAGFARVKQELADDA